MMEPMKALGVAIDAERVTSQMTREELASALGIVPETLNRYLRGDVDLRYSHLISIADALGIEVGELLVHADVVAGRVARRDARISQANSGGQNVMVAGPVHIEGDVDISAPQGDN